MSTTTPPTVSAPAPAAHEQTPAPEELRPWEQTASAGRTILAGTAVGKALRFGADLLLGRGLGPAGFGIVSACSSLVFLLAEIALLGVHRALLRFASVHESRGERSRALAMSRKAVLLPVAIGLMMCGVIVLLREPMTRALFGGDVSPWILPLFATAIPAVVWYSVQQFAARAGRRFVIDTLIGDVARVAFPLLGIIVAFSLGWRLAGVTIGIVAGILATAVFGTALLRIRSSAHEVGARQERTPCASQRELLRVALPLALASSSILLMNELDKVMLAIFRPEAEVGLYNAAFRLSRQANLFLPALTAAISPWVAPLLAEGNVAELRRLYLQTTRWSVAVAISVFFVIVGFSRELLGLFGPAFEDATHLLLVLASGQLVIAVAGSAAMVLQFSGNERRELANGVIVAGLNIVLNLALIPRYGAMGAAIATAVSLALINVRRILQVRRMLATLPWTRKTLVATGGSLGSAALALATGFGARALGASSLVVLLGAGAGFAVGWTLWIRVVGLDPEDATLLKRRTARKVG